jgi:hypothetical protein
MQSELCKLEMHSVLVTDVVEVPVRRLHQFARVPAQRAKNRLVSVLVVGGVMSTADPKVIAERVSLVAALCTMALRAGGFAPFAAGIVGAVIGANEVKKTSNFEGCHE